MPTFALLLAHADAQNFSGPRNWGELAHAWSWEPFMIGALLLPAWLYRRGLRRLRTQVGPHRGLRSWEVASFWIGWWTLVIALLSPLHPWGKVLFAAHMTQHELLMVAAAPLLVLGRPIVAFLFAIPIQDARQLSRVARRPAVQNVWHAIARPSIAWVLHAVTLWTWHVPRFFEATLTNEFIHDFQHVTFFGTALMFWWALIHGRAGLSGLGLAVLYLFTTMMHTGVLGALLTFAGAPLYPAYADGAASWSLTPLEDQQLGGLIMWVPAGLVYLVAALALVAGWMRVVEADPTPTSRSSAEVVAVEQAQPTQ